jgi:hypothetical protein
MEAGQIEYIGEEKARVEGWKIPKMHPGCTVRICRLKGWENTQRRVSGRVEVML